MRDNERSNEMKNDKWHRPKLNDGFVMPSVVGSCLKNGDEAVYVEAVHLASLGYKPDKKVVGECMKAERHLLPEGDYVWYLSIAQVGRRKPRVLDFPDDMGCGWYIQNARTVKSR